MSDHFLIVGGAGFIGTNVADRQLRAGKRVTILDSFQRPGTRDNAEWLVRQHGNGRLTIVEGDIRDARGPLASLVERSRVVLHLAAQAAVTASVRDPREDFEINALGTFNVLEAARRASEPPIVLYGSTTRVYGGMADLAIAERARRYELADLPGGIAETHPLGFHSPFGCSKGAGDQYLLDYHRTYGLRTIVMRQSCIYGPHQHGVEEQGWVAWLAIQAMRGRPVTIHGDGRQTRDILFVEDLADAYDAALRAIDRTAGQAYNIGGGPENTLSLRELLELLATHFGRRIEHRFDDWRPDDRRVYVSDVRKAARDFGWRPTTSVRDGLARMLAWLGANEHAFTVEQRIKQLAAR